MREELKRECGHTCRQACGMMNELLREEALALETIEHMLGQCTYPDVRVMFQELLEEHRQAASRISRKMEELSARMHAADDVLESLE
jgi:hypothetical protein